MPTPDEQIAVGKDEHLMGRLLILGTLIGFPLIFVLYFLLITIAGAHGAGMLFIAAWAALIGGTFVCAGIILAPKMAELDEAGRGREQAATTSAQDGAQASRASRPETGRPVGRPDQVRPAEG